MDRRALLGAGAGSLALTCAAPAPQTNQAGRAVLVGSANALAGMLRFYDDLLAGAHPLDVAIEVVKVAEADPSDTSVGLGGLPNEEGVVELDAACMDGETHKGGGVAGLRNILHPSEVARLVMERTDHCLLVGDGAYRFARAHGHPHVELLTESSRAIWMKWREEMSDSDDRFPPPKVPPGNPSSARPGEPRPTGTIHCSALSVSGQIACVTSTSGLAYKLPGRVGDSPLIGSGLYCDAEVGSAGSTGRGEAVILAHGSSAIVELLRQGMPPKEAGLEVLKRIARQSTRQSGWQPALLDADDLPSFNVFFYVLATDGSTAGVSLRGRGNYAVADPDRGPRHETSTGLFPKG